LLGPYLAPGNRGFIAVVDTFPNVAVAVAFYANPAGVKPLGEFTATIDIRASTLPVSNR
jgi:hypothetical protein